MKDKLEVCKYAYNKVPVYAKIAKKNNIDLNNISFEEIPFVEKEDFIDDCENGISAEYVMDYMRGDLIVSETSGSTGKCLYIYWNKKDYNASLMPLILIRKKRFNILPNDKMCFFYTVSNEGDESIEENIKFQHWGNRLGFSKMSLNKEKVNMIYNKMLEFEPKWMSIQPSMAILLANVVKERNLPHLNSLSLIELTGEIYTKTELDIIKECFDCNIVSQYGCNEMNSIAYECENGNLHCTSSNVYVEVINDGKPAKDGEEGNIYLTSLNNVVMPFVRYGIGDRGRIYRDKVCKCGNCSPILELTSARRNDKVIHKDGSTTSAAIFINIIEKMNRIERMINSFQIIQKEYDKFEVKLVLDKEFIEESDSYDEDYILDCFIDNIDEVKLSTAEFEFEFCEELVPDNVTGKLRFFINEIDNDI